MIAQPQETIRRREDGTIDTGHYAGIAAAERRAARDALLRSVIHFLRRMVAGRWSRRLVTERAA